LNEPAETDALYASADEEMKDHRESVWQMGVGVVNICALQHNLTMVSDHGRNDGPASKIKDRKEHSSG
jgi:hypothetical protein